MKVGALLLTVLVASVFGCTLMSTPEDATLVLSLSSQTLLRAKTIEPLLDMDVDHYDVYGAGPAGATFEQLGITGTTVVQASLLPGEWVISVEAYNGDSPTTHIGFGTTTVTIAAGDVLTVPITVSPVDGRGQLDVTVTWPAGVLLNPVVNGVLAPSGGSGTALTFTNATDELSANFLSPDPVDPTALEDGYYTLILSLTTDRSDGTGSDVVWGTAEIVRIIAGEVSEKTFGLVEDVNRGGIELEIDLQLDNPIEVNMSGVVDPVEQNVDVTVTAAPGGLDLYEWYLDGVSIGSGNPLTFSSDVVGHHWLSVMVTSGGVMSSSSVEFDVVAAPEAPEGPVPPDGGEELPPEPGQNEPPPEEEPAE